MIRSMTSVLCRTLLAVLDSRGIHIFAVAQATCIPLPELRRLCEFGTPLDSWAMKKTVVSKPKGRATAKPFSQRQAAANPRWIPS